MLRDQPNLQTKQNLIVLISTNMARSKPNRSLKSPHKQQLEEQNNQEKTETHQK
jgi:hypothetical protein